MQKFSSTLENYNLLLAGNALRKSTFVLSWLCLPCTATHVRYNIPYFPLILIYGYDEGHTVYTIQCFQIKCVLQKGDILHTRWKICGYKTIYNYTTFFLTINVDQKKFCSIQHMLFLYSGKFRPDCLVACSMLTET